MTRLTCPNCNREPVRRSKRNGFGEQVLSLVYIGQHVVPAIDQSLPFLRLGDPAQAFRPLAVGTLAASCATLVPCALLVRLPR